VSRTEELNGSTFFGPGRWIKTMFSRIRHRHRLKVAKGS
jgi:hypothetical protein